MDYKQIVVCLMFITVCGVLGWWGRDGAPKPKPNPPS